MGDIKIETMETTTDNNVRTVNSATLNLIPKSFLFCFSRINHITKNPTKVEIDAACKPITIINVKLTVAFTIAPIMLVKKAFEVFFERR